MVTALLLLGADAVLSAPPPAYQADYSAPPQYQFEYRAEDEYAALQFGQQEQRDGAETSGQYSVLLPDGRLQTVTYTVLGERGFEADISYDGEAGAYSAEPAVHRPQPPAAYRPAPAYHARPVYGARRTYGQRARTYTVQSVAEEAPAEEVAEEEEQEEAAEEAAVEVEEVEEAVDEAVEETEAAEEEAEVDVATAEESYQEDDE